MCKVEFDIVWSFDNSVFFDFTNLKRKAFCISHIVDYNQNFQFNNAAKSADLCLSCNQFIINKQLQQNPNSYFINHGFSIGKSAQFLEEPESQFRDYRTVSYAGNLNRKDLDWGLLSQIVSRHPEVTFRFAGPGDGCKGFQDIVKYKNVDYHGILKSNKLQLFYSSADILLICYKYRSYPEQLANPHKMMEYLGSGKMIVATWTEEYSDILNQKLILMSKTDAEFLMDFNEAVLNIDKWNGADKIKQRKEFALDNTYMKQIERIEGIIGSLLSRR